MKKYKVGYAPGVWDLFHVGHLNLLERCKETCDYLIVAVCDDDYVINVKKKTPAIPEEDRMRIVGALKCVDEVVLVNSDFVRDKKLALAKYKFDVLLKGDDWRGTESYNKTEQEFAELGIAVEYFPYTKGVSSTAIKEKLGK